MYDRLREVLTEELTAMADAGIVSDGNPEKLAGLVIAMLEGYDFYRGMLDEGEVEEFGRFCKESVIAILRGQYGGR